MTEDINGTAVVLREESVPSLLMGTPADRVTQATQIANALAPVITNQKLYANISGKRHVLFEGWSTLGALVGVFPITDWVRETETGFEARVEARTLTGAIVGAAIAECSRQENRWKSAADHAIKSMAQTRAGSKALRMPLGFIMQLAGFESTPAEEMVEPRGVSERDINADGPTGGQAVMHNKAKLAGYMTANKLKAIDVLRLLGLEVADGTEARSMWDAYIETLQKDSKLTEDEAYAAVMLEIGAE